MKNKKVTEPYLLDKLTSYCKQRVKNKKVIVACDTTDYNLNNHKNRISDMQGLGWSGDNTTIGFMHQGLLVYDRDNKSKCYGWAGSYFYKRDSAKKNDRAFRAKTPIEGKESYKWLGPSLQSRDTILDQAEHTLFVMDREADVFEVMSQLPKQSSADVLIRIQQNRRLKTLDGNSVKLYEDIERQPSLGIVNLRITGDARKRKKRIAHLEVKSTSYYIKRSAHIKDKSKYPKELKMQIVQVREQPCSVPMGEKPIIWRLWTSEPVENFNKAVELLNCYISRWHIEEAFRLLKTEGFDIESTELESGIGIRKLLLIAMQVSVKIMQLKSARLGNSEEKIVEYFTADEIEFMDQINDQLEGQTEKLKNPNDKNSLSFASWVIARFGGWKGYESQRPPGTITFKKGLERFELAYLGYAIGKDVCKR